MVKALARVARSLSVVPKTDIQEMSFLSDPATALRMMSIQQPKQASKGMLLARRRFRDLHSLALSAISNTPAARDRCRKMSKLKAISIKLSPASPSYFCFQTTYFS
jgi:hypothetical protein